MRTMANIQSISVQELNALRSRQAVRLMDVRTPGEFGTVHAQGAVLVPLDSVSPQSVAAAFGSAEGEPIYVICKAGGRSMQACQALAAAGLQNVVNVAGGTDAWVAAGLPVERQGRQVLPLDRQIQTTAGLMCLSGAVLGYLVNPWFYLLCLMVGFGLTLAGLTGFCPMAILMRKMPWNQGTPTSGASCCAR